MKNKILASLLAVCLFVGLAVPAFAMSSQSGIDSDIKTLEFSAPSFSVENGGTPKKLAPELQAYASLEQGVQEPTIEWSIKNDTKFAFAISETGEVSCSEDAGEAIVTAKANDGKVLATVKVVATKKAPEKKVATSFVFDPTSTTLLTGAAAAAGKGDTVTIKPAGNTYFTQDQIDALVHANVEEALKVNGVVPEAVGTSDKVVYTYGNTATGSKGTIVVALADAVAKDKAKMTLKIGNASVTSDEVAADAKADAIATAFTGKKIKINGVNYVAAVTTSTSLTFTCEVDGLYDMPATAAVYTLTNAKTNPTSDVVTSAPGTTVGLKEITAAYTPATNKYVEIVGFPINADGSRTARVKKSISIATKKALVATKINAVGDLKIEVGQKANVAKYFKQGPSASNIDQPVTYSADYYGNDTYNDYAELLDNGDVIGVAVGKNKVVADIGGVSASIVVEVVKKGSIKPAVTAKISHSQLKMVAGKTQALAVNDTVATNKYTWESLDKDYVTVDAKTGVVTAVKATPAGKKAKVRALLDGKQVDGLYSNIVVIAVDTTNPADKPTTPPATGV